MSAVGWSLNGNQLTTNDNVGIGTNAPRKPLDIGGSGGIQISQTPAESNSNEIYFSDNGQIRSFDDNHRIIFNRATNELEFREYGTITFSPGATNGQKNALIQMAPNGVVTIKGILGVSGQSRFNGGLVAPMLVMGDPSVQDSVIIEGGRGKLVVTDNLALTNSGANQYNPVAGLNIVSWAPNALGPTITLANSGGGAQASAAIDFTTSVRAGSSPTTARIMATDNGNGTNSLSFLTPGAPDGSLSESVRITSEGQSGSGRLTVKGDISVSGDVLLTGADCAEHFDAADNGSLEPGTVVVIDQDGALQKSSEAYDKKVAGVVSGAGDYRHGIVLDRRPSQQGRVPVALIGKVFCKVDAVHSPIAVGDLLTTSPTEGHAMKAVDATRAFGCVIGKALRSFTEGQGLIPILVALQ